MTANLIYWSVALSNLALLVGIASYGIRQVRRNEPARHHRSMIFAGLLVLGFLLSYAIKLAVIGREDLSLWAEVDLLILRIHELCIFVLLVGGLAAVWRARPLRSTRNYSKDSADPEAAVSLVRRHRRAGWVAFVGALLGLMTAALVLVGMYRRADFI